MTIPAMFDTAFIVSELTPAFDATVEAPAPAKPPATDAANLAGKDRPSVLLKVIAAAVTPAPAAAPVAPPSPLRADSLLISCIFVKRADATPTADFNPSTSPPVAS